MIITNEQAKNGVKVMQYCSRCGASSMEVKIDKRGTFICCLRKNGGCGKRIRVKVESPDQLRLGGIV